MQNGTSFTPQLAVSNNGEVPSILDAAKWDLVTFEPGLNYLQILDQSGQAFILAAPPENGSQCTLITYEMAAEGYYNAIWATPYPNEPRIIFIYAGTQNASLSLDASNYPNICVGDFDSGVNQTWMFSNTAGPFNPFPPFGWPNDK